MPYALCNDCSVVSGNIRSQRLVHHFNQLLRPTVLTPAGLGPKLGLPGGLLLVIGESSRADCPLPREVLTSLHLQVFQSGGRNAWSVDVSCSHTQSDPPRQSSTVWGRERLGNRQRQLSSDPRQPQLMEVDGGAAY